MAKRQMSMIYYYVPEDLDDPECPNAFGVFQAKQSLKLSHIHDNFPLKGTYIFRFKMVFDGSVGWLDLPDADANIPLFKERVFVKATRVSWNDPIKHHSQYKEKPILLKNCETQPNHRPHSNMDFFEHSSGSPILNKNLSSQKQEPIKKQYQHVDFLADNIHPLAANIKKEENNLEDEFFGGKQPQKTTVSTDFLGASHNLAKNSQKKVEGHMGDLI